MAKKLKKKIEETCGLTALTYPERRTKAEDILANKDWKQRLCNDLVGLSFRELEKVLLSIIAEREVRDDVEQPVSRVGRDGAKNFKAKTAHAKWTSEVPRGTPRTLAEILAQVRAPRRERDGVLPEQVTSFLQLRGSERPCTVLQDSAVQNGESEE